MVSSTSPCDIDLTDVRDWHHVKVMTWARTMCESNLQVGQTPTRSVLRVRDYDSLFTCLFPQPLSFYITTCVSLRYAPTGDNCVGVSRDVTQGALSSQSAGFFNHRRALPFWEWRNKFIRHSKSACMSMCVLVSVVSVSCDCTNLPFLSRTRSLPLSLPEPVMATHVAQVRALCNASDGAMCNTDFFVATVVEEC